VADGIEPVDISIDMENDHLYWLDQNIRKLFRSDLDITVILCIISHDQYYMVKCCRYKIHCRRVSIKIN
jgi:hypothetical protein